MVRPPFRNLGQNRLSDLVAGLGEGKGDVRVEALQLRGVPRAADPCLERGAAVRTRSAIGERATDPSLSVRRSREICGEIRARSNDVAPALNATGGFETRDGGDQVPAGEVVGRRKRHATRTVRILLCDGRPTERTACSDAPERARRATNLPLDEVSVIHADTLAAFNAPPLGRGSRVPALPGADALDDE